MHNIYRYPTLFFRIHLRGQNKCQTRYGSTEGSNPSLTAPAVRRLLHPFSISILVIRSVDGAARGLLWLFHMGQTAKSAAVKNPRKRRALAVLARSKLNSVPKSIRLVGFRPLTAAESAYGKTLGDRAGELLAEKRRRKIAAA